MKKIKYILGLAAIGFVLYWPISLLVARAFNLPDFPKGENSVTTSTSTVTNATSKVNSSGAAGVAEPIKNSGSENKGQFTNNGSDLKANSLTPSAYVEPQYDMFSNEYNPSYDFSEKLKDSSDLQDAKPFADFKVTTDKNFNDKMVGTTNTVFTFDGNPSNDKETDESKLEFRFDFESDGKWDTFFSYSELATHKFEKAGDYTVSMQVMDKAGNVSTTKKMVKVVNNTPPSAVFFYQPVSGTNNTIFAFDTSKSSDSQYGKSTLKYRFDFDNDGVFDTKYDSKTLWKHKFDSAGNHVVKMEVVDPEGLTADTFAEVTTFNNTPPTAVIAVRVGSVVSGKTQYIFDASGSSDVESPKNLKYRWDFNYTGSDDIVYDTTPMSNSKYTGYFNITGKKTIRLEVTDGDGAVSYAYATFTAE